MKVICQSCQAKYTIADEKVRGKVAKIRCKKCGTTIIVDGNDPAAAGASEPPASGPVADYTQQGGSDEQWTVLVADGDQRTLTPAQVAELYASGTVGFETLVWKDGMGDWQAIAQTDALRSVLENGPRPTMTPLEAAALAPSTPPSGPPPAEAPAQRGMPAMAARSKAVEPAAARRPGRGGGANLFGAAAHEDILTSASDNAGRAGADGDKLTGARNENSVLFSLSALTGSSGSTPAPSPDRDPASNKADLRALMGGGGGGAPAKSKIDDIMNLSGGGVYSPGLLAAPALAPPPIDLMTAAAAPAESGGSKSKSLMMAIGGAVLVIGAVAIAFTTMSSKDESDKTATAASAGVGTNALSARGANTPNEGPNEPAAAGEAVRHGETARAPETPPSEPGPVAVAPGSPAPKPEGEKSEKVERKATAPKAEKPAAAPPVGSPPPPVAAPAPAPAAPAPAAPAAGGTGDVDRATLMSALSTAATAAQACKKPDGPTGSGRVAVTFANNGLATTATVDGPPFAGTPVGGCVAARFRSVHIPPFAGSPITVRKSFTIN